MGRGAGSSSAILSKAATAPGKVRKQTSLTDYADRKSGQLKRDRDPSRYIHGMAVPGGWPELYLLRFADSFLIEAVAKTVQHSVNHQLTAGEEGDAQHHVTLNAQLPRLAGVFNRRL